MALRKIYYLHQLAIHTTNVELIRHYNKQKLDVIHKAVLRMDPSFKQIVCKKCHNWLTSVLDNNTLKASCLCGYSKSYSLEKPTRHTDSLGIHEID